MRNDDDNIDKGKSIEKPELVECDICGYHHDKTKKCPQCSMRSN
jgi:rubrerythrin